MKAPGSYIAHLLLRGIMRIVMMLGGKSEAQERFGGGRLTCLSVVRGTR
jgi:hypothetical protein